MKAERTHRPLAEIKMGCFHVFNSFYFASILYVTKPKESRYLTTNGSLLGKVSICHRKQKRLQQNE